MCLLGLVMMCRVRSHLRPPLRLMRKRVPESPHLTATTVPVWQVGGRGIGAKRQKQVGRLRKN